VQLGGDNSFPEQEHMIKVRRFLLLLSTPESLSAVF